MARCFRTMEQRKLQAAIFQLERVKRKKGGKDSENNDNAVELKRFKYIWIKECVDSAIKDLEEWQKKFDPSWFLIMKVVNPIIDQELAKGKTEVASISTAKGLRDSLTSTWKSTERNLSKRLMT